VKLGSADNAERAARLQLQRIGATIELIAGKVVSVDFNETVSSPSLIDLLKLRHFSHLRSVDFYETEVTVEVLQALAPLPKLQKISLNCCHVDDAATHALNGARALQGLYLMDTKVTDNSADSLEAFTELRCLRIDGTRVSGTTIERVLKTHKLEELWLDGAQATPACVKSIASCESLQNLTLVGSLVTDEMIKPLARMLSLRRLTILRASITDQAIRAVALMRKLETLGLNDCKGITDAAPFAECTTLNRLWLPYTSVTAEGIASFMRALPNATIWPSRGQATISNPSATD
jgi:Leucine-rich repeat (LRR) protein